MKKQFITKSVENIFENEIERIYDNCAALVTCIEQKRLKVTFAVFYSYENRIKTVFKNHFPNKECTVRLRIAVFPEDMSYNSSKKIDRYQEAYFILGKIKKNDTEWNIMMNERDNQVSRFLKRINKRVDWGDPVEALKLRLSDVARSMFHFYRNLGNLRYKYKSVDFRIVLFVIYMILILFLITTTGNGNGYWMHLGHYNK